MSTSPRLRVAIAYVAAIFLIIITLVPTAIRLPSGAGLGGLVLALSLQKNCPDVTFNVYEAAHQLGEIGAGIGVWPRVWEILRQLGLEEDMTQIMGTPEPHGDILTPIA